MRLRIEYGQVGASSFRIVHTRPDLFKASIKKLYHENYLISQLGETGISCDKDGMLIHLATEMQNERIAFHIPGHHILNILRID
jgi:hypothetical protein